MTSLSPSRKKTTKKTVKKVSKKPAAKKAVKKPVKKAVGTKSTSKRVTVKKTVSKKTPKLKSSGSKVLQGMPAVGQLAPAFALKSDTSGVVSLSKFRGKNVVLYFYPKDDTPGCTVEACSFQENKNKLMNAGAVVIGVSPDSIESHAKFRKKYGLDFILVADEDHKVAEAYGVWVEKNMYGKKKMGIQRATFLIDPSGRVAYVWPKVSVEGHTEAVLGELRNL